VCLPAFSAFLVSPPHSKGVLYGLTFVPTSLRFRRHGRRDVNLHSSSLCFASYGLSFRCPSPSPSSCPRTSCVPISFLFPANSGFAIVPPFTPRFPLLYSIKHPRPLLTIVLNPILTFSLLDLHLLVNYCFAFFKSYVHLAPCFLVSFLFSRHLSPPPP